MTVLGVDLGYGDTKLVTENNKKSKFPSRWSPAEARDWGLGGNVPVLSINGGESFMFGDDATGSNIREPQGDGRLTDPNAMQLLAGALWKSGIGKKTQSADITLASGTQLGSFDREVKGASKLLEGMDIQLQDASGEKQKFKISKLVMRPQGVGAAIYLLNQGLIKKQYGNAVIIDIGYKTTDVLTLNLRNLEPITEESFSIEAGVGDVVSGMSKSISRETGFIIPSDVARDAIGEKVTFKQHQIGGSEVSAPLLDSLAQRIVDEMRENLRDNLERITSLIPVGGGSILIGEKLEELAPGYLVKVPPEDMQFANVLGYSIAAAGNK
jgi:actin-like ATPase involved in cell morphogenesis